MGGPTPVCTSRALAKLGELFITTKKRRHEVGREAGWKVLGGAGKRWR